MFVGIKHESQHLRKFFLTDEINVLTFYSPFGRRALRTPCGLHDCFDAAFVAANVARTSRFQFLIAMMTMALMIDALKHEPGSVFQFSRKAYTYNDACR